MWTKRGHIFSTRGVHDFSQSHAQVPVVLPLGDKWRIFYATRNAQGQSHITFLDVDVSNPSRILYEHTESILPFGAPGTFDDCGVMPSCAIQCGDEIRLYYIGWTVRGSVPYHNAVGLAISKDGGKTFERAFEGPIITVNAKEPYFSGTSFIIREADKWRMYYLSCIGWKSVEGKFEPYYHIKIAHSLDGLTWSQSNQVAIELEGDEGGLVSASVVHFKDQYHMWYGVRKDADYRSNTQNTYRIGYATSADGLQWNRQDDMAGITLSPSGWDSEMISYPYVIKSDQHLTMLYNGNGFGKTGFGYAERNI